MGDAEEYGKHDCARPEADAIGQSVQRITAQKVLFRQPHKEKSNRPFQTVENGPTSMQGKAAETEGVKQLHDEKTYGQRQKAPEDITDEKAPEHRLGPQG